MLKAILSILFKGLTIFGFISIIGSILTLIGVPFFTRWEDWSKLSREELFNRFYYSSTMLTLSVIYFKYIEHKIPDKNKRPQYSKCPKCKEVFNYNELIDGKCKYCKDVDTIDIEEYFKQYPNELEDKEK